MATIDALSSVLATTVTDTDVIYVGLPLNADPDRQMLVGEAKDLFLADDSVTTAKILDANVTNAKIATGVDAAKLADGSVSNTEFQYLDGVTSDIQTQLDGITKVGYVSSDASGFTLPSGWSVALTGTGTYTVTHNRASSSYVVMLTPYYVPARFLQCTVAGTNSFNVASYDSSGTASNCAFHFAVLGY